MKVEYEEVITITLTQAEAEGLFSELADFDLEDTPNLSALSNALDDAI